MTIRESFAAITPPFLSNRVAARLLWSIGLELDALRTKMENGIKARFPGVYTAETLADIGNDRLIDRGPTEPAAAYADRLSAAFDTWRSAGNAIKLLENVAAYFSPSLIPVRLVDELGFWFELDPSTQVITRTRPGTFPAPAIDSVSPTTAPDTGLVTVTVNGSGYFSVSSVTVCGYALSGVVAAPDGHSLTGTLPAGMTPQTGDVVVTALGGTVTKDGAFTVYLSIVAPVLTSSNYTQVDSSGGDTVTVTGTSLSTSSAARIGDGTTWTSCTLGTLTATTAQVTVPAKTAGVYQLQIQNVSGWSNSLAVECWAPSDDAASTLTFDSITSPYDATTGVWVRRKGPDATYNMVNLSGTKHAASGGAPVFDGDVVGEGGLITNGGSFTGLLGAAVAGNGFQPGAIWSVHETQSTYATSSATYNSTPYSAPSPVANGTQGTIGIDDLILDGQRVIGGHVYGQDGYTKMSVPVADTGLHTALLRWQSVASGTSAKVDLSVDGALAASPSGYASVTIGSAGATNTIYLASPTMGDCYPSSGAAYQSYKGRVRAWGVLNAYPSDSFITKLAKWKLARFGA